jgi:3-deoxy-D-manno-octulosonic-acid transferase
MTLLFDILFLIYILLYLPILILRGKWHAGMTVRFGFIPDDIRAKLKGRRNIWLHAVSVGEVIAVEEILRRLRDRYPDRQIVLSVTTKTGYSVAQRKYQNIAVVLWSPLDFSFTVRAFASAIHPEIYIAAETELWPNLFARLSKEKVKILIVNGRISDEAFPRYRMVRWALRSLLSKVSMFCMQSELDAQRIIELGAPAGRVKNVGNVKFDLVGNAAASRPEDFGFDERQMIWVAGSTHPGEEEIVASIYDGVRSSFPELRLVIAPRHPERSGEVAQMLRKMGFTPVLFSSSRKASAPEDILVVDTIGHLLGLYSIATVVFVGKSLTIKGGHNIIEPAVFGKPVLIGPNMQNFKDITRAFLDAQAVIQVSDAFVLKRELIRLMASQGLRTELGQKSREVVRQNRGATERTVDVIRGFMDQL